MSMFKETSDELLRLIAEWEPVLLSLPLDSVTKKRNRQNRTVKQIIGHLCDSATNNTHRTVYLQYRESPLQYPNYATHGHNDKWIALQNYQEEDWFNLVQLWKYTNLHLAHVFLNVDPSKLDRLWDAGDNNLFSLNDCITDYLRHFRLHLDEVKELMN